MLRLLARFIGYLALAAAFVTAVVDGTRSIAAGRVVFSRVADPLQALDPALVARVWSAVPAPVVAGLQSVGAGGVLDLPAGAVLLALAALLFWLGARRDPEVGVLTR